MTTQVQDCLNHVNKYNDKMALRYFGDDMGWGVVAKEEFNQCDNLITFYASKIQTTYSPTIYNMTIRINCACRITDAYQFGNLSRFMIHLPSKKTFIDLPDLDKTKIAKANCKVENININRDSSIPAIVSTKSIRPHEVIGFDYGACYWRYVGPFWLVDKNGKKIIKVEYDSYDDNKIIPMRNRS